MQIDTHFFQLEHNTASNTTRTYLLSRKS